MIVTTGVILAGAFGQDHSPNRLAILIAAPWSGDAAMHRDIEGIVPVLQRRGFRAADLVILDRGPLERQAVLDFLREASRRVLGWRDGEVFLYVTGHGGFVGRDASGARVAVRLAGLDRRLEEIGVFWEEIFATLKIPAGVSLTVLPDT
jgi:cupin superfamily acireductone dioxygenase involved in methionine salvage